MSETHKPSVITNTSPLLYLHQIGHLKLLQKLYQIVIVPPAVVEELGVGQRQGIDVPDISIIKWIQICPVKATTAFPSVIDLGKGEAEVIALGLETSDCLLILDDKLAQRIVDVYYLSYTGTLGVLIKAKRMGYLEAIAPVLVELQDRGMWLNKQVISDVLKLAGE